VVAALLALYRGQGAGSLTLSPVYDPAVFSLATVVGATSIAVLSFLGFDGISTLAEESLGGRDAVARATLASLLLVGVLFIVQTWVATDLARGMQFSSPETAFYEIAGRAGGTPLRLLVIGANILATGIANALAARDCEVRVFPHNTPAEDILKSAPSGIVLSNGPGDPADPGNSAIIKTIRALLNSNVPIFGICMGHQLMALAKGYKTRKLKFGHRGANQPVKDTRTGRVYITSQNHGYEVIADDSSFVNVNDRSCEGLDFGVSFSVQFHPEACGGPLDTSFLFDHFIERMDTHAAR